MSTERKHIKLGFSIWATGFHPAGWRLPGARHDSTFDPAFLTEMAQVAERGKLDFFFIGDRLVSLPETQAEHPNLVLRQEALTLASFISAVTRDIGVVTTVNTTYSNPFVVARATATVDHLSRGRLALNIVTGRDPQSAANFSRAEHWGTDQRFDNATEFTEVLKGLWDSWEDDALVGDKARGVFVDADRVHAIRHKGEQYSIAGPLNIVRPVQGQIPLLTAGESERSREFGARFADIRFGSAFHIDKAKAYYADIKSRLAKNGRRPEDQSLVTGIAVYVGDTLGEARDLYRQIQSLTVADFNLGPLSAAVGVDLSGYGLDTRLSSIEAFATPTPAAAHILEQARDSYGEENLTLRELYLYFRRSGGGAEIVGDARKIADVFETWFHERAADGFILFPPYLPGTATAFVDKVVPELQRRGLLRTEYDTHTFRDHFGLERPENVHAAARRLDREAA
jgi:FMN-dependent oxidoreductase (nitrilotriacetate monooxygenase family)